jgi:DNA-directed RNA polymerase subunit RPC12/RpoP
MAWKPEPRTYECSACGWSITVAPESDVLTEGYDHFTSCPKCGNRNLVSRPPTPLELLKIRRQPRKAPQPEYGSLQELFGEYEKHVLKKK